VGMASVCFSATCLNPKKTSVFLPLYLLRVLRAPTEKEKVMIRGENTLSSFMSG
jgi:hypothetical protein